MTKSRNYIDEFFNTYKNDVLSDIHGAIRCKIVKVNGDKTYDVQPLALFSDGTKRPQLLSLQASFIPIKIKYHDDIGDSHSFAKQDKLTITPADDSKVAHLSGANNFDTTPTVNNNPLLLASSLPSDLARTGQANTFSLLQTFSQGIKTLQTGSYDDANSLVNEGLYFNTNLSIKNGAGTIAAGFIQVLSGYWERVRQFMYSDVTNNLVYTRISTDNGKTWSKL
uniref:pyocin knob domain-containing protein n=1 Tax=Lentilactobacillus hilgardii TaxID=1588 RepID=UPI00403F27E5